MIAVDTSALMAILLDEPSAADCAEILANEHVLVSAATVRKHWWSPSGEGYEARWPV